MTKLKTRLLKDLPVKTTPITDDDYVINSNNGTTKLKVKDITKNLDQNVNKLNSDVKEILEKGTTVEVIERVTKQEIDRQIKDGTMAKITIADNSLEGKQFKDEAVDTRVLAPKSVTLEKLGDDIELEPQDGSVSAEKLGDDLITFNGNNILNPNEIIRGLLDIDGNINDSATYITTKLVRIKANTRYTTKNLNKLAIHGVAWYDKSKKFISYGGDTSPSNASYLRVRIITTVTDEQLSNLKIMVYENKGTELQYEDYKGYVLKQSIIPKTPINKFEGIDDNGKLKDELINWKEYTKKDFSFLDDIGTYKNTIIENKSRNIINPSDVIEGSVNPTDGTYNATTTPGQKATEFIEIEPNAQYMCTMVTYGVCWYDKNKNFIKHSGMPCYNPTTSPTNAKYIRLRINSNNISTLMFYKYEGEKLEYEPYDQIQIKETLIKEPLLLYIKDYLKNNGYLGDSNLAQLKWYVLGDSISCGGDGGYQGYVSRNLRLNRVDKARMGNHMTYSDSDGDRYGICWEVENFNMSDADIITILIATNDWANRGKYPLGNPDGSDGWTTFYGALHRTCNYLSSNFIGKRIGFITPPMRKISKDLIPSFMDYINAMKEVCGQYSIPVLDLWHEGGLNTFSEAVRAELIEDGLHPNTKGQAVLARPIEAFIKRL